MATTFRWQVVPFTSVVRFVAARRVVAVDGRSSSGKTTLAGRLAAAVPGACVVHTDDVAWHHAVLDWADLLRDGILQPARAGRAVAFRPPQWDARGRPGSIDVPAGCPLLLIEGVGAGRRSLASEMDAVIWVESDLDVVERRNQARVAAGEITPADYESWMAEENPFVAAERTWERADLVVSGSATPAYDPATEIVVAQPARWEFVLPSRGS
ncbi:uridine kinase family protein [Sorangium sp. So ce233]|uniref:uridine kinase family protein n=1 Tax=Sorangium sp. So ce233 TaxID=3133290 RepID=UPI003F628F8C